MAADGTIFFEEVDGDRRGVFLRGVTAPKGGIRKEAAFEVGGTIRSTRTYEPGVARPVRHIMGTAEGDWEFEGQLRDGQMGGAGDAARLQDTIDGIRTAARELRIVWGNQARRGYLVEAKFPIEGGADRLYKLRFEIDGEDQRGGSLGLRRARRVSVTTDLTTLADSINTTRTGLLSVPGLSFDVASAITDLYASAMRPLTDMIGAFGDIVDSIEDTRSVFKTIANNAAAFLDRAEHLAGTIDSYNASALDRDDGAAVAAWTRARADALVALHQAAARATDVGADAERRAYGSTGRIYVTAQYDTIESIARREGTTPEAIWALNPDLPMAPVVGTRIRLP